MTYQYLFQPLQIKNVRFKNRLFSAPVITGAMDGNGYFSQIAVTHYIRTAQGGAAMVSLGDTPVDRRYAASTQCHPVLDDPGALVPLTEITKGIHEYNAVASIELNHAGNMAHAKYITGASPIGPVDYVRKDGQVVKGMDEALMAYTLDSFGQAAAMAKLAGFDVIAIQAGHGWLLHQFLSPRSNTRKDRYGGNIYGRARFPLEALARVREVVGPDVLIQLNVSGAEHIKGGGTLEETIEFVGMAQPYVDLIYVSASVNTDTRASTIIHSTPYQAHGLISHYAEAVRQAIDLPVVAVGGIMTPEEAEATIASRKADAVAMGRALIADPYLPIRAKRRQEDSICPCVRCLHCLHVMSHSRSFGCTVNPLAGREWRLPYPEEKSVRPMNIAVVGGGPAGMVAALSAVHHGHAVTLYERSASLGGMLSNVVSGTFALDTADWLDYLKRQTRQCGTIHILLNTEATPEELRRSGIQAAILATGSLSRAGELPRDEAAPLLNVEECYGVKDSRVLIVGGGASGCEAALRLAEKNREVTILDQGKTLAHGLSDMVRVTLLDRLAARNVRILKEHSVLRVTRNGVLVRQRGGQTEKIEGDVVVAANGRAPDSETLERFAAAIPTVVAVGGCRASGTLYDVVHSAYFAGRNIEFQ